jgi:hypothetical protein
VKRTVREGVNVEYELPGRKLVLSGESVGPRWKQLNLVVNQEILLTPTELENLGKELARQGYEFVIFRLGPQEIVSQEEQDSALAELKQMGYQVEISSDRRTIRESRLPGIPPPSKEQARERAPRMMELVFALSGRRRPKEVLLQSSGAVL